MKKEEIPNYESMLKTIEENIYEELSRVQKNKTTYSDTFIEIHLTEVCKLTICWAVEFDNFFVRGYSSK